jgi:hypothetical protein
MKEPYTGKLKLYKSKTGNQNQLSLKFFGYFNNPFTLNGAQEVLLILLTLSYFKMVKNETKVTPLILDAVHHADSNKCQHSLIPLEKHRSMYNHIKTLIKR